MFKGITKKYRVSRGSQSEIDDGLLTLGGQEASRLSPELKRRNVLWAWIGVFVVFLLFLGRLFFLNVVQGSYYTEKAFNNKTREYVLQAPRGKIYDRTGKVLVQNVPSTDIVIA